MSTLIAHRFNACATSGRRRNDCGHIVTLISVAISPAEGIQRHGNVQSRDFRPKYWHPAHTGQNQGDVNERVSSLIIRFKSMLNVLECGIKKNLHQYWGFCSNSGIASDTVVQPVWDLVRELSIARQRVA